MPHKHSSPARRRRNALRLEKLRQRHYIKKDHELIHLQGKPQFFEPGEVIEAPRHLSPSYVLWVQSQLTYEYYRKKEREPIADQLRED